MPIPISILNDVQQLLYYFYECIKIYFRKFDICNFNIISNTILKSFPFGAWQETHLDYDVYHWNDISSNIISIGIISLCNDTKFCINHSATSHFKEHQTTANFHLTNRTSRVTCLSLRQGEFLLFRSEVAHFGASQSYENYRIHCVLQSPLSKTVLTHDNTFFFIPDQITPKKTNPKPLKKRK